MTAKEHNLRKIRDSVVNGIFYSDSKDGLKDELRNLFSKAVGRKGSALAIISPHAGYNYSGVFSAESFLSASGRSIGNVVVISSIHRDPEDGVFLPESEWYSTPLGEIPVNQNLIDELLSGGKIFKRNDIPHLEEHCIELQVPFIQHLFPHASIVPVLIGKIATDGVKTLSSTLESVFTNRLDDTLFVISTNLTTYGNFERGKAEADNLLDLILKKDADGILQLKTLGRISTCGALGICAVMLFKHIDLQPELLSRGDSSIGNGDTQNGVHYAAVSFSRSR